MIQRIRMINRNIGQWIRDAPVLPVLVISFLLSIFFVPGFISVYNLKNYMLQASDLLIISCGLTFVVLNGGIDFSITSVMTLSSVVGAYIMGLSPLAGRPELSIPIAITLMMCIGIIIGLLNGISVTFLKMPSFIASLATQLIFLGIAILFTSTVTDKTSIGGLPEAFFVLGGTGHYFFLPILISVLVWLVTYWMLKYTIFGHHLYAVGTNPKVAHISGISVNRIIMRIMILSGLFASIASIIITARNQVGISSLGDKMFITIIASVIVGGTSTSGGTGGVKQTLFGVLFITLLNNTMNLLGIGWYTIMLVLGFLILLSGIISFGVNNPNMSKIRGR